MSLAPDHVAELRDLMAHVADGQSNECCRDARDRLAALAVEHLPALLDAADEAAKLQARLHYDCQGCPGCSSNDCPDALDAVRAQRDALVAAGEPVADALRDIARDGHSVYLDGWDAAIRAAKEATNG